MRTITIKSKGLGRYDDVSPFLVDSGELELKINLPNLSGEFFFVSELNGKSGGAKPIPRDGTVILTGLEAGEIHAEVKHYMRGGHIETYKIEPLLLKAVDTKLSATPEIAFLTGECKSLREKVEGAESMLEKADKRNHERDIAFLSYAWADYQNNVQLNAQNLSLADFAAVLGYELTEEELEKINSKKEAF